MKERFLKPAVTWGMAGMLFFLSGSAWAQGVLAPQAEGYYHLLDRYEIRQGAFSDTYFTSFKPVSRRAIASFVENLEDSAGLEWSKTDQFNLQFLLNDNWEWTDEAEVMQKPILKYFYRAKPDFFHVNIKDFDLHLNPVLYVKGGIESDTEVNPYVNTRGLELRATIDEIVGIYTFVGENQAVFPSYVRDQILDRRIVPGEGFWKRFKEDGVDFFTARGYVSVQATRHIGVQLGQDRFFIGNGARSMILSDIGNSYPFLKIQTQVWRFNYTNLFTQLRGNIPATAGGSLNMDSPKKFMALHHLSLNVTDNFNIGLFEAIVSGDSVSGYTFDVEYFNPVIFYRAIEHYGGSQDNAMVGMDMKWNFLNHFQVYGQFVLDEFLLSAYREGNGWWANKWASQLGVKYIDFFGLPNVDLQLEWNRVRPFMYAHKTDYTNYTHYSQPLAHPLGANFDEKLAIIRYQPLGRWTAEATFMQYTYGADTPGWNAGGNIFRDYVEQRKEFGNIIGQGVATKVQYADFTLSYMPAHRLYLELTQTFRRQDSELDLNDRKSSITQFAVRWNIGRRNHMF